MNKYLPWVIFGIQQRLLTRSDKVEDKGHLVLVQVLVRHGARAPIRSYPNDPHANKFVNGWGNMTLAGEMQVKKFGGWLRSQYYSFLPSEPTDKNIHVQSSDVPRTRLSAKLAFMGMYNKKPEECVTVHCTPKVFDKLLVGEITCPRYNKELRKVLQSDFVKSLVKDNKELIQFINLHTGLNICTLMGVTLVYDILRTQKEEGLDLPAWSQELDMQLMKRISFYALTIPSSTRVLQKFINGGGTFIKQIIANINNKITGKCDVKLFLFCAHDTTILNLLNTLQLIKEPFLPDYTSAIIIELWEQNKQHYVQIKFKEWSWSDEVTVLQLPGCEDKCPLEKFVELTKDVVPGSFFQDCQLEDEEENCGYKYRNSYWRMF